MTTLKDVEFGRKKVGTANSRDSKQVMRVYCFQQKKLLLFILMKDAQGELFQTFLHVLGMIPFGEKGIRELAEQKSGNRQETTSRSECG